MDLTAEAEGEAEVVAAAAQERSAHALALRFERDQLVRGAAEAAIRASMKLGKARRPAAQRRCDAGAWRTGRDDAGKLSTGRALA